MIKITFSDGIETICKTIKEAEKEIVETMLDSNFQMTLDNVVKIDNLNDINEQELYCHWNVKIEEN